VDDHVIAKAENIRIVYIRIYIYCLLIMMMMMMVMIMMMIIKIIIPNRDFAVSQSLLNNNNNNNFFYTMLFDMITITYTNAAKDNISKMTYKYVVGTRNTLHRLHESIRM